MAKALATEPLLSAAEQKEMNERIRVNELRAKDLEAQVRLLEARVKMNEVLVKIRSIRPPTG